MGTYLKISSYIITRLIKKLKFHVTQVAYMHTLIILMNLALLPCGQNST